MRWNERHKIYSWCFILSDDTDFCFVSLILVSMFSSENHCNPMTSNFTLQ